VDAVESRSIGAETLAWHAVCQLQLAEKLTALGFNGVELAARLGQYHARMVSPGSELHTHQCYSPAVRWVNYWGMTLAATSLSRLYRVSDQLLKHQTALEGFLADQEQSLFNLNRRIVLYDLTTPTSKVNAQVTPKPSLDVPKKNGATVLW